MSKHRNSPQVQRAVHYTLSELKHRAAGRWIEILSAAGMPSELLESRRGLPCPRCGGVDRFSVMKDLAERGAVLCRHCHNANTEPRAGDGIATLRWWLGLSLPDVVLWLGDYLGGGGAAPGITERVYSIPIPRRTDTERFELMANVWRKNMRPGWIERAAELLRLPVAPLERLRVGWSPCDKATAWPMRNETGDVIGIRLRCPVTAKKWAVKGSAAGLFYSPSLLSVERHGRLWIVEGPTDAAAMLSLGFDCVGVPSAGCGVEYLTELARRILPGEVVILADRDEAGRRGAERLSDALVIVAPVRIVSPPQGIKDARAWVCSGACRDAIELAADCVSVQSVVMEGE